MGNIMLGRRLGVAAVCVVCSFACAGEKGDTGAPGEPGATGANGKDGQDGSQGVAGPGGIKGDTGAVGPIGPQGVPGEKGDKGDPGDKGDKGDPGTSPAQGGAGGEAGADGAAGGGGSSEPEPHAPGLVVFDKDGQPVDAWVTQGYVAPYGQTFNQNCVGFQWIGQRYAEFLQLDLPTGTFEPCYPAYASWAAVAKANGANLGAYHSTDCTGPLYAPFSNATRVRVSGVLQEVNGTELGPMGTGTGQPVSYYSNDTCKDGSNDGVFEHYRGYVPLDAEFKATFTNPPYSIKVVY